MATLNHKNIDFHQLHYFLSQDHGLHADLHFGEKIITNHAEMDQYWHDYAWIVKEQWDRTWQQLERDQSNKTIHLLTTDADSVRNDTDTDKYKEKIAKRIKKQPY